MIEFGIGIFIKKLVYKFLQILFQINYEKGIFLILKGIKINNKIKK